MAGTVATVILFYLAYEMFLWKRPIWWQEKGRPRVGSELSGWSCKDCQETSCCVHASQTCCLTASTGP